MSLLFIPLFCESTVYSIPLRVYCLLHSYVSLLFIPHNVSLLFIPLLCRSTVYSTPESTVYFTPLKVYCLFQSYVSLLFITFLLMLLCFVVPSKSFCQVVRKSGNVIPVSAANGQIITFCNISMNTTLQTSKHAESTSTTNNQQ